MRFLNPKTDFAFKKIFGSDQSRDILLSFLNAMLELPPSKQIIDVTILDPYQAPKLIDICDNQVDVCVLDKTNQEFFIKIQILSLPLFEQDMLYDARQSCAMQFQHHKARAKLNHMVLLTIADFVMFHETKDYLTQLTLLAEAQHPICSENLTMVFVELPKFNKTLDKLEKHLQH